MAFPRSRTEQDPPHDIQWGIQDPTQKNSKTQTIRTIRHSSKPHRISQGGMAPKDASHWSDHRMQEPDHFITDISPTESAGGNSSDSRPKIPQQLRSQNIIQTGETRSNLNDAAEGRSDDHNRYRHLIHVLRSSFWSNVQPSSISSITTTSSNVHSLRDPPPNNLYVDDFLFIFRPDQASQPIIQEILQLLKEVGIQVNFKKSQLTPSTKREYLGFLIDSVS